MDSTVSRRHLLSRGATLAAVALFGTAACGKEKPAALSCTDTMGLSTADLTVRGALAYVDYSTEPGKQCLGCQQFLPAVPAVPAACGQCKVVKGPINPAGYCKSFVAKTT